MQRISKISLHRFNDRWAVSYRRGGKRKRRFFNNVKNGQAFADSIRQPPAKPSPRKNSEQEVAAEFDDG